MGMVDENAVTNETNVEAKKKVTLTIGGNDQTFDFDQLGVNIDSSEREILNAVQGIISETNLSIEDESHPGEYTFTVRKSLNTEMIYVYPKDPAGN